MRNFLYPVPQGLSQSARPIAALTRLTPPVALSALLLAFAPAAPARAASVPTGFTDVQITAGLTSPTSLAVLPGGRILVMQQDGIVRMIKSDGMLPVNFHRLLNVDSTEEHGCLGLVPDPGFASNHYMYMYCSIYVGGVSRNRVIRVTEANDIVVAGSERVIFELPNIPAGNHWHMGGPLAFGKDGKLYIAVGNHEDSPQPVATATSQNLASPFGKILRINSDGTIPPDNPYYQTAGAHQAIYALGFRNPFVMDIQPDTGVIMVGDVGQSSWEEINRVESGRNYGWPAAEGNSSNTRYTNPLYAYSHNDGCAITGLHFYNPAQASFPAGYVGQVFFADFCSSAIKSFNPAAPYAISNFASGIGNPTNIAVADNGSLYYLARNQGSATAAPGAGTLSKISYTGGNAPNITSNPSSTTVMLGAAATFSVGADGATQFQWQRNGVNIANAGASSYTIAAATMADNGARFRVIAFNTGGNVISPEAVLTVTSNRPPVAEITFPGADMQFTPGQVVNFAGSGTDPEDGTLPASAYSWKVDFQHDSHAHAFVAPTSGIQSGSFTVPAFEENEANMWVRISLTVTDSSGASTTLSRNIFPARQISQFPLIGTPVNGWGPYEVDRSNGEAGATDGRTIALSGVPYLHGLGVHAPSDLRFALEGRCNGSFIADIGVDSESGTAGSVAFQVYLDNVKAYDSGTLRGGDVRKTVNLNVAGKRELRLVVTDAGDGVTSDHADWAGARVNGCNTSPTPPQEIAATISNLQVFDNASSAYWSVQNNLKVGNTVYGDRAYTFASLPAVLVDGKWIRTANDAKKYTGTPLVNFALSAPADVYVALDNRAGLPAWVDASWADTGADLTTKEGAYLQRFRVFKKRHNAGVVSLGSAKQPGLDRFVSMYMIVIK